MTTEQKQHFKQTIDTQIQTLSKEIELMKAAVYPERGKGPSDKVKMPVWALGNTN